MFCETSSLKCIMFQLSYCRRFLVLKIKPEAFDSVELSHVSEQRYATLVFKRFIISILKSVLVFAI